PTFPYTTLFRSRRDSNRCDDLVRDAGPSVDARSGEDDLLGEGRAIVAVGHDDDARTASCECDEVAAVAGIRAAVREAKRIACAGDGHADPVAAHDMGEHVLGGLALQDRAGFTAERPL